MINTNINKTVLAALVALGTCATWATAPESWEGNVVLPANDETETITLSADVTPTTLTVKGKYVIEGTGVINPGATAGNVTIESGASLTLNNGSSVPTAGYVVNGELILKKKYSIDQNFSTFTGKGTIVVDGVTLDNSKNGAYGSAVKNFTGTLTLKNNATVKTSTNSNQIYQLGQGKVIFAGGTTAKGHSGSSVGNTSYEIEAGTSNTLDMTPDLTKMIVVKGDTALVTSMSYTVMTLSEEATIDVAVSDELKTAGWGTSTAKNAAGKYEIILKQMKYLTWNGSADTDWTATDAWLKGESAATFADGDKVTLSAAGTEKALTVSTTVTPSAVFVYGTNTVKGAGQINSAYPIWLGTNAVLKIDPGAGKTVTIDSTIATSEKANYEIQSGTVNFTKVPFAYYTIDTNATMVLKAGFASAGSNWNRHFTFNGTLVVDGVNFSMGASSCYGADLKGNSGNLVLKNGAVVTLSGNNGTKEILGNGVLTLAGATIAGGGTGSSPTFTNSRVEIVAGTTNNVTTEISFPLAKAVVTGDPATLTGKEITVLTVKNPYQADKVTLSQDLAKEWKLTVVDAGDSGKSLVLVRKPGFMIIVR